MSSCGQTQGHHQSYEQNPSKGCNQTRESLHRERNSSLIGCLCGQRRRESGSRQEQEITAEIIAGASPFIHSGYFYSASSSPLLLRCASDTAQTVFEFHAEAPQATASEELAKGKAARAG